MSAILLMYLLVPISCASARTESEEIMVEKAVQAPMPMVAEEAYYEGMGERALSSVGEERMIVRTGDMSLVVEGVAEAIDEIAQLTVQFDGYVVSSWISGEEQEMRGNISIRVPDEKFEEALTEFRNMAIRVDSESTNSRDVTEEYIDLEARFKNAEAVEDQYLALLDKANDVEDILRIYDSLSRVRGEIEQIEARMQYLERTSSMSLITIRLEPEVSAKPLVSPGWNIAEVFKSVIRGIASFGQALVTILIWLLILIPIWGTILGIFLWRRHKRKISSSVAQKD